jgi:hypothetical protein
MKINDTYIEAILTGKLIILGALLCSIYDDHFFASLDRKEN